jgi:hypothetical protein
MSAHDAVGADGLPRTEIEFLREALVRMTDQPGLDGLRRSLLNGADLADICAEHSAAILVVTRICRHYWPLDEQDRLNAVVDGLRRRVQAEAA